MYLSVPKAIRNLEIPEHAKMEPVLHGFATYSVRLLRLLIYVFSDKLENPECSDNAIFEVEHLIE